MNKIPPPSAENSPPTTTTSQNNKLWQRIAAVAAAILFWQIAATVTDLDVLLVSPVRVVVRLFSLWREADFFSTVFSSFSRIVLGFLAAFLLSGLLALLSYRFPAVEVLLRPYVVTVRAVPVASFIIIGLIWLSTGRLAAFISFLMVFPILYQNVLQGLKSTDPKLLEMAKLYRVPYVRRLHMLHLPAIKPYLLSACSVALGMSWKAGVAAEVIGMVDGSIGEKLYYAKIYLDTCDLFAWTVVLVLASVLFEKAFLFLLKKLFAGSEKL
ncbi:MAG: ABC transporter permease subunit [Clostridia bacterium]|nr:ABC transporter permease subunit [Clostridia bacterium]